MVLPVSASHCKDLPPKRGTGDLSGETIVVFDSDCVLCSAWVRFLLRHEAGDTLRFASSRKTVGRHLAAGHGVPPEDLDLTYLVIRQGRALVKSDASLALCAELKAPWRYLRVFRLVPEALRDRVYDLVARNRLKWFGERPDCLLPTAAQRRKFLDEVPVQESAGS